MVRQPSTTEYLPGMLHANSPAGLLPQFPSWSLVCLGPSSLYSHNLGLQDQQQAGLLGGSAYLLPWDVTVRLEHHRCGMMMLYVFSGVLHNNVAIPFGFSVSICVSSCLYTCHITALGVHILSLVLVVLTKIYEWK